jgi:hypothetical protein
MIATVIYVQVDEHFSPFSLLVLLSMYTPDVKISTSHRNVSAYSLKPGRRIFRWFNQSVPFEVENSRCRSVIDVK